MSARQLQQHNTALGAAGEQRAVSFLVEHNFLVLDTNVRIGTHEVDIIATDATGELVFIEVKTRSTSQFGHPSVAVTRSKIKSLQLVARTYLREHPGYDSYRFDVISVLPDEIGHFQNVTWLQ